MKIMIVEDDQKIIKHVRDYLGKYGYDVVYTEKFEKIPAFFLEEVPQLVLMDINLPYFDGFYWCKEIRKFSKCPILFLSARDGNMDQVMALEYGADDYLTKPFSYELLIAKINSHIRRVYGEYATNEQERVVNVADIFYYPERLELSYCHRKELLTKKEGELVELLLKAYPNIVSREAILNKLWDDENFVDDNTLSVNIARLRKKLTDLGSTNVIQTIRGKGYQLLFNREEEA